MFTSLIYAFRALIDDKNNFITKENAYKTKGLRKNMEVLQKSP